MSKELKIYYNFISEGKTFRENLLNKSQMHPNSLSPLRKKYEILIPKESKRQVLKS